MTKERIMTKEECEEQLRKNRETMQEQFMEKILNDISYLNEKSNQKDYEPTDKERNMFGQIVTIVNNMNKWF